MPTTVALVPNSDIVTGWPIAIGGGSEHFSKIDEIWPSGSLADYIYSDTGGSTDIFGLTTDTANNVTKVTVICGASGDADMDIETRIKIGGVWTTAQSSGVPTGGTNEQTLAIFNASTDPSLFPISQADVDAMELEIKHVDDTFDGSGSIYSLHVELEVPTLADAVDDLTAENASNTQIDLVWSEPEDNGEAITGYKIERESPVGGGWSTLVADTGTTATSYSDSGLAVGTEYNYRVIAINADGESEASNEVSVSTPAPVAFLQDGYAARAFPGTHMPGPAELADVYAHILSSMPGNDSTGMPLLLLLHGRVA